MSKNRNKKFKKAKKGRIAAIVVSVLLVLVTASLAFLSQGFSNWNFKDRINDLIHPNTNPGNSLPPGVSEDEEIIDLVFVNRHIMNAVNESVILTITVSPSNAHDKTVVWSSSDPAKVSVVALTETTARITCLTNFAGNVIITATATQGTAYTSDDVTATCTVSYNHPVESIELKLWNYGTTPAHTQNAQVVTNYTNIQDFTNYYGFEVTFVPSLPTINTYTFVNSGGQDIEEVTTISNLATYTAGSGFKFDANSTPEKVITVKVVSTDEEHEHSISLTVGKHMTVSSIKGNVVVKANDNQTVLNTYSSFTDLLLAVQTQGKSWNAGVYIRINIDDISSYSYPSYHITFDTSIFQATDYSPNFTKITSGIYLNSGGSTSYIVLKTLGATSGTQSVAIDPEMYSAGYTSNLPFALTEPVASITIDKTTHQF